MTSNKPKIIAILGPTASGKTAMSIELAQKFNGEIICLDSRTIYEGMDIGTAKPTQSEMQNIPHHLINIATPDKTITLSEIKKIADEKISDILSRNKLPFLVGGTALYAYAILENWQIPEVEPDIKFRQELENKNLDELVEYLKNKSQELYNTVDLKNKRRVIRALEILENGDMRPAKGDPKYNYLKIGLDRDKQSLRTNIKNRTQKMLADGLIDEVKNLISKYYADLPAFSGIHYKEIIDYLNDKTALDKAIDLIDTHDWQLTRRQLTWLKRDKEINWIKTSDEAEKLIYDFLK